MHFWAFFAHILFAYFSDSKFCVCFFVSFFHICLWPPSPGSGRNTWWGHRCAQTFWDKLLTNKTRTSSPMRSTTISNKEYCCPFVCPEIKLENTFFQLLVIFSIYLCIHLIKLHTRVPQAPPEQLVSSQQQFVFIFLLLFQQQQFVFILICPPSFVFSLLTSM